MLRLLPILVVAVGLTHGSSVGDKLTCYQCSSGALFPGLPASHPKCHDGPFDDVDTGVIVTEAIDEAGTSLIVPHCLTLLVTFENQTTEILRSFVLRRNQVTASPTKNTNTNITSNARSVLQGKNSDPLMGLLLQDDVAEFAVSVCDTNLCNSVDAVGASAALMLAGALATMLRATSQ